MLARGRVGGRSAGQFLNTRKHACNKIMTENVNLVPLVSKGQRDMYGMET